MARFAPLTFWRALTPGDVDTEHVRVEWGCEVVRSRRGDVDEEGVELAGGTTTVLVSPPEGLAEGWKFTLFGQNFVVFGIEPEPPLGVQVRVVGKFWDREIREQVEVSVGGEAVTVGGEPVVVGG